MPGFIEDTKEEWRKLPTWGKWTIGLVFLAVVGIAAYELYKSQQNAAPGGAGTSAGDTTGSSGGVPLAGTSGGSVDTGAGTGAGGASTDTGGTTADTGGTPPPAIVPPVTSPAPGPVTQPPPAPTVPMPNPIFMQFATPNDNPAAWTPQPVGGFANQAQARAGCVSNCHASSVHCKGRLRGGAHCASWCSGKCAARHP